MLSTEEIRRYRDSGYVIPRYRLSADALGRLRDGVDRVLATYTDVAQEDLANPHMIPSSSSAGANPFLEAARDSSILDMMAQLLGPDLILWITRILCKPPVNGREVPWHQDGEYWPMRPLATCSVWIALDPVSSENGCMRFIPGSHRRQELYRHHTTDRKNLVLNLELDHDQFDESSAVNVELEAGQMSLHDVRMIHGSLANRSGRRRAALIMRYMPATSHYDRSLVRRRRDNSPFNIFDQPLMLMRGSDRSGRNDFSHGHELWQLRYGSGLGVGSGSLG